MQFAISNTVGNGSTYEIPFYENLSEVNFDIASKNFVQGSKVEFSDFTQGDVSSREWVFENGSPSTSSEESPLVEYKESGSFDVELNVTFSDGSVKTLNFEDYVTVTEFLDLDCLQPSKPQFGLVLLPNIN